MSIAYGSMSIVACLFVGLKPVIVAIVMEAGIKIGKGALVRPLHFWTAGIAFLAIFVCKVPLPSIVVIAEIAGWMIARVRPETFTTSETNGERDHNKKDINQRVSFTPPTPLHDTSLGRIVVVFLGLWLFSILILAVLSGPHTLFSQLYLFFTQAAFVTFGGVYAGLAYVSQSAIDSYGWLTHGQMLDSFSLAETTLGPLLMVLQFVGFMAGWNQAGNQNQVSSTVLAGLLTTYATFLPYFFFIFLETPYIELLRGNRDLSVALATITAAVVGVVMNLAIVLGFSVFWPHE